MSRVGSLQNHHTEDVMSRDQFKRLNETTENPPVEQNGHSVPSTLLPSGPSMRNPGLDRAQRRRRMAELADPLDRTARNDLNYFTWFSDRKYRLRVAEPAEIELAELLGEDMTLPPSKQHYMVVYRMNTDVCLRTPVTGPANADQKLLHEELARAIFEENGEKQIPLELMFETVKARK
jgi:hypothetical protein